jgi:hypothetical protein
MPMSAVIDLTARRRALEAQRITVIAAYKSEIYDWCGHDFAIELTSQKLGVPERAVRTIVEGAGDLWSQSSGEVKHE